MLYELMADERAFDGATYTDTIFAIVNKPHFPLSHLLPELPPRFSDAIDKALAKSPEKRYPDVASFARRLDDIAHDAHLSRNGMPPVIVDTRRLSRCLASLVRTGGAMGTLAGRLPRPSRGHAVAKTTIGNVQSAIGAPMTHTGFVRPPHLTALVDTVTARPMPDTILLAVGPVQGVDAFPTHVLIRRAGLPAAAEPGPALPSASMPKPFGKTNSTGCQQEMLAPDAPAVQVARPVADQAGPLIHAAPEPVLLRPVVDPTQAGSMSSTPGPHVVLATPLGDAERAQITGCLAGVLGPIAPCWYAGRNGPT